MPETLHPAAAALIAAAVRRSATAEPVCPLCHGWGGTLRHNGLPDPLDGFEWLRCACTEAQP
jgi:hypothetical protein